MTNNEGPTSGWQEQEQIIAQQAEELERLRGELEKERRNLAISLASDEFSHARAVAAEARLAAVERETIERCAKICDTYYIGGNPHEAATIIRALAQTAQGAVCQEPECPDFCKPLPQDCWCCRDYPVQGAAESAATQVTVSAPPSRAEDSIGAPAPAADLTDILSADEAMEPTYDEATIKARDNV